MLGWGREESRFALEGKLVFAHITDTNWKNKWKGTVNNGLKLVTTNALLVVTGQLLADLPDMSSPTKIIFPKENIREAVLLLLREKTSRFSTLRVNFISFTLPLACLAATWRLICLIKPNVTFLSPSEIYRTI